MARPRKTGLDYFPHDVDVTTDPKIEPAIMRYGAAAYAFYFIHLEYCYRSDNLSVDISATEAGEEMRKVIQKKIKIGKKQYDDILKSFLRHGAFNAEVYFQTGHLTSNGIKKRAGKVFEKRAISNRYYKNTVETPITEVGVSATETMPEIKVSATETMPEIEVSATETMPETPQSIVKKRIEEKRIEEKKKDKNAASLRFAAACPRPDDVSQQVWDDFVVLRKDKKAKLTATALAAIRREAEKAGITLDAALSMCCMRGWQGFQASWAHARDGPRTEQSRGNGGYQEYLERKYASFFAATDEKTEGKK